MKYLEDNYKTTLVPESKADHDYLKKMYPHLNNFFSVVDVKELPKLIRPIQFWNLK